MGPGGSGCRGTFSFERELGAILPSLLDVNLEELFLGLWHAQALGLWHAQALDGGGKPNHSLRLKLRLWARGRVRTMAGDRRADFRPHLGLGLGRQG